MPKRSHDFHPFAPDPTPVCSARRAGFTLLEVLIVIAIILMLMALLLAVGAGAKRMAKRRACLSTFQHIKDAQAILRNRVGWAVDEQEAAGWQVVEGGGPPRPMTTMEYFHYVCRNSPEAKSHIDLVGKDQILPSTGMTGSYYTRVQIYAPLPLPLPATLPVGAVVYAVPVPNGYSTTFELRATLYDDRDPGKPVGTVVSDANRAPLWTIVSPWGKNSEWDYADWTHSSVSADGLTTFKWRPHELDFRKFTDDGDPKTDILKNVVPPYLPPCETTLVSAPGADGLWGKLTGFDVVQRDADAKDNLYSNQRDE